MGWINHSEQQHLLTLYGKLAKYRCNYCRQPIFIDELMVTDPKGGYHSKPPDLPTFLPAEPKVTYHMKCSDLKRGRPLKDFYPRGLVAIDKGGKAPPPTKGKQQQKAAAGPAVDGNFAAVIRKTAVKLMTKKPKSDYWTRDKLTQSIWKKKAIKDIEKRKMSRRVVRTMIEDGVLKKNGEYLKLAKKK